MRTIKFYKTPAGQSPVEEFIDGLHAKQAQRVAWVLRLIEELREVPADYFKKLANTEDLWEVRVSAGPNAFRLLGFFDGSHLVVLVHAFSKKTQKTPLHAIQLAQKRKRDYRRKGNGNE